MLIEVKGTKREGGHNVCVCVETKVNADKLQDVAEV